MAFQQYPQKGGIPSGNTAGRPSGPVIGDTYYNGQLEILEIWNGSAWVAVSAPPATPSLISVTDVGTSLAFTSGGTLNAVFAPGSGGGTPSQYNAFTTAGGFTASSSNTTVSLTGLTPATSFTVYGNAQNNFGTTVNTANAAPVTATTTPQAPTIGTATLAGLTVDVTWTLGATGGKNLTAVTVTPYIGATAQTPINAATTSSTSLNITGLTGGSSYTFKVKATNANGSSVESSATNSVTIPTAISADSLIIAGGGGAAGAFDVNGDGGGGGAGGLLAHTGTSFSIGTTYTVTVGSGGTGGTGGAGAGTQGTTSNITGGALSLTATVGGGLGRDFSSGTAGGSGGSGGGGGNNGPTSGGTGTSTGSQGQNGGGGQTYNGNESSSRAGGGGGYSQAGNTNGQGTGGNGTSAYSSWGSATSLGQNIGGTYWFAGGGSGSGQSGGSGGGGGNATNGTANTGGGGGAFNNTGSNGTGTGGNGGTGLVIMRFSGTYTAAGTTGSPTRTVNGGYTYYAFTGTGSITI